MKKLLLLTAFLCIGFCSGLLAQSAVQGYLDGQIFIKYKYSSIKIKKTENPDDMNIADLPGLQAAAGAYGITKITKPFYQANDDRNLKYIYKVYFTNKYAVESLIRDLGAVAQVEYAEKVPIENLDLVPNDTQYGSQWHLPWIGAPNAWNIFNGNSPITVAIVDNAVDINHVDLTANIWVNPGEIAGNSIDDDQNGFIDDVNGWDIADKDNDPTPPNGTFSHGTHCAGIAGARTNNATGVAGIGFNIKIMPVKATPSASTATQIYNGYEGIIYAAKSKARVISCSWGGTTTATSLQYVMDYAWNKGCIICCSAGNDNNQVLHYPAALNHVYAVASSDNTDTRSGFSCYGTWVDITAPGSNILSTYPFNTYNTISGTSMACPLTAGLCGLILAKNPYLTQNDVLNCINTTAVNIATLSSNSGMTGKLGAGRINADGALQCSNSSLTWKPTPNFATLTPTVCPSTNVQFIDKTLYNPTSWNWTFASGTPATSTSSAPVVTWAAPGVYGVTLTASNGNGANTASKSTYITITNPVSLPLQEGFQTGTAFPPQGWTPYDVALDSAMWEKYVGTGGFNTSTVCARFNNWDYMVFPDKDELRTPKYNMTAVTTARLRFDVAYALIDPIQYAANFDTLEVRVSTNCGNSWSSIYIKGGPTLKTTPANYSTAIFVPLSNEWRKDSITLSGAAQGIGQGNVMFSFVNRCHYGQPIYIDNINLVYSATAPPTANWNTSGVTCSGQSIQLNDQSVGTPTAWAWQMPGGVPASSTLQNPTVTYSAAGVYNVTLTASNGFGGTQSSKQITVTTTPTLSVASTKGACFGNCDGSVTATLVPGTPPYTYSVTGGSCPSATACANLCPSNYTYVVVDSKGCISKKPFTITSPTAAISSNVNALAASCGTCANGSVTSAANGGYPGYTYSWSPGGATTATLSNVVPGCYTLTITDSQGCTDVSSACVGFSSGMTQFGNMNGNVLIIPNPNNGQFLITADIQDAFDVIIYNSLGQLIKTIPQNKSQSKVDLSGYGKGIYNVILSANGNYKNIKVVIE